MIRRSWDERLEMRRTDRDRLRGTEEAADAEEAQVVAQRRVLAELKLHDARRPARALRVIRLNVADGVRPRGVERVCGRITERGAVAAQREERGADLHR